MPRYLVVDDSPTVRSMLAQHLVRRPGVAVDEAATMAQAAQLAARAQHNVIFLGMRLANDESTLPLLHSLLASAPSRPIVLCTTLGLDHPEVQEAMAAGACGLLPKPVRGQAIDRLLMQIEAESGRLGRIR